jgi:hypothetical protein
MKMNKVMNIILCLCIAVPVMSMELQKVKEKKKRETVPLLITPEENKEFILYLEGRLGFCDTVTTIGYVPQNNPIKDMLQMLSADLCKTYGNDVSELVKSRALEGRINRYKKSADSYKIVQFCLQQIRARQGDVNEARNLIVKNRRTLAEMKLQKLQPTYSCDYIGANQIQDKVEYMERNAEYPADNEDAIKDFVALLIYQVICARQTY